MAWTPLLMFVEEHGLDATAEVPDADTLACIMDGPGAPMADHSNMLAGLGMAGAKFARHGIEHFSSNALSAPEPHGTTPGGRRGKARPAPKPQGPRRLRGRRCHLQSHEDYIWPQWRVDRCKWDLLHIRAGPTCASKRKADESCS